MAKRLFLVSIALVAALAAFGLWATELRDDETELGGFYLVAVGIGLLAGIVGLAVVSWRTRGRS
jgi:hypothetical protein